MTERVSVSTACRYDVFLSYRQAEPDKSIATKLFRGLETYRTPKALQRLGTQARLQRAFRDREELAASHDLGHAIRQALTESRYLVVLCSPRARESYWINEEILFFKKLGRADRILAVLLEGNPQTAYPDALQESGAGLLLAADGRASSPRQQTRLLGDVLLRLLAPILGCHYDDLRQRDSERKTRRLIAALAATITVALGILTLAAWALFQRDAAVSARGVAISNEKAAFARLAKLQFESARSESLAGRFGPALLHLNEARRLGLDTSAVRTLQGFLQLSFSSLASTYHLEASGFVVRESPDGRYLYAGTGKGLYRISKSNGSASILWNEECKSVELSGDGEKVIAVAGGVARVLDSRSGTIISEVADAFSAQLSNNGKHAVITRSVKNPLIVDLSSGTSKTIGEQGEDYLGSCFDPASHNVAIVGANLHKGTSSLRFYRTLSGDSVMTLDIPNVRACLFSPSGRYLAASSESEVVIYDLDSGRIDRFNARSSQMRFSGDSRFLGSAGADGAALVADLVERRLRTLRGHSGRVSAIEFVGDNRALTAGQDSTVRLWNLETEAQQAQFAGHWSGVSDLKLTHDLKHVLSISLDRTIRQWEIVSNTPSRETSKVLDAPIDARLSGKFLAAWTSSGAGLVASVDGAVLRNIPHVPSSALQPNGRVSLQASTDGSALMIANLDGFEVHDGRGSVLRALRSERPLLAAAISHDGNLVAFLDEEGLIVVPRGGNPTRCKVSGDSLSPLASRAIWFSPEDDAVLVIVRESSAHVFNIDTNGAPRCDAVKLQAASYTGFAQVGALHGGKVAIGYDDGAVVLFDGATRSSLRLLGHTRSILSLSFSPDGRSLASIGLDEKMRIWDVADGLVVELPHQHGTGLAISWDGPERVYTFGADGRVRGWHLPREARSPVLLDKEYGQLPWELCGDRVVVKGLDTCNAAAPD